MNKNALINFGHPILSENKIIQRNQIFSDYDHFYIFPTYLAEKNHDTLYVFDDKDILRLKNKFENLYLLDIIELTCLYEKYFPKAVQSILNRFKSTSSEFNIFQKLFSLQERLNELVFFHYFYNEIVCPNGKHIEKYNKFTFMSNSFYIEDKNNFVTHVKDKNNWFIMDYEGETPTEKAKGIWSCDLKTLKYMIIHMSWDVDDYYINLKDEKNDAEKYKYKLFTKSNLSSEKNYGFIKKRINMPKNGTPQKMVSGCTNWISTLLT